ncbi:MAG TPA: histidine phosphatase family protein [Microbacteriaceae bacterium]|nr:histidine phosphatase family protein [Microbacteriaceae bacterium]
MTSLYLVRHGETDWNLDRRIQGSTDIPLNETGRAQAARTGRLLSRRHWDGIVSSPLSRAVETGRIIGREIGIDQIETMDQIVERHYGAAEGLADHELSRLFPGDTPVPGRETREHVAARVIPALVALAEGHPGANLIVTTHGGVIRTLLNAVAPDVRRHRGIPITNGSVHSFRHVDGGLELVAFDDPIDEESVVDDYEDFIEQNAVERREISGV